MLTESAPIPALAATAAASASQQDGGARTSCRRPMAFAPPLPCLIISRPSFLKPM